jgi:hypothetical protein
MRIAIFGLVTMLLIGSAKALPPGQYVLIGSESISCGAWLAARRQGQGCFAKQWVLGFLSGVGAFNEEMDPLDGVDADEVWAWMDNYCHANPLDRISTAAMAFVRAHPDNHALAAISSEA